MITNFIMMGCVKAAVSGITKAVQILSHQKRLFMNLGRRDDEHLDSVYFVLTM